MRIFVLLSALAFLACAHVPAGPFAPNPYTLEELRAGCDDRMVEFQVEQNGTPIHLEHWLFAEIDEDRVEVGTGKQDTQRNQLGAPSTESVKLTDLHARADFPLAQTQLSEVKLTLPAGTFDCTLYTVTSGEEVRKYWFAHGLAGPPVKMLVTKPGNQFFQMKMIATRGPSGMFKRVRDAGGHFYRGAAGEQESGTSAGPK